MKKIVSILMIILMICAFLPAMAENAAETFVPAELNPEATEADYAGEWACAWAMIRGNLFAAETNLEALGMDSLLTLKIENGMGTFTGLKELGADPLPLVFVDGTLVFEPEKDIRVLTLQLLQDGTVSMNFNMVEFAPTLYLFRAETEQP